MQYKLQIGEQNKILRTISQEIIDIDKEILEMAKNMKKLTKKRDGVWLAAPQIGLNKRLIYTSQWARNHRWDLEFRSDQIMINPIILENSKTKSYDIEWCLSLPDLTGRVKRYDEIKVKYTDLQNQTHTQIYRWFDARVIQHEIDHLDGILFVDIADEIYEDNKKL